MNKTSIVFFAVMIFTLYVKGQTTFYFFDAANLDTISNFKLSVYNKTDEIIFASEKNKAARIDKDVIKKADSIILRYDSWYEEKIPKDEFAFI